MKSIDTWNDLLRQVQKSAFTEHATAICQGILIGFAIMALCQWLYWGPLSFIPDKF